MANDKGFLITDRKVTIITGIVGAISIIWTAGFTWAKLGSDIESVDKKHDSKHEQAMSKISQVETNQKEFAKDVKDRLDSVDTKQDKLAEAMYRLEGAVGTRDPQITYQQYLLKPSKNH